MRLASRERGLVLEAIICGQQRHKMWAVLVDLFTTKLVYWQGRTTMGIHGIQQPH
jgi:hypothetical protein